MENIIANIKGKLAQVDGIQSEEIKQAWVCRELKKPGTKFPLSIMHKVYRGLSDPELNRLQTLAERDFPNSICDFYNAANGLSLFYGSISIGGLVGLGGYEPISLEYGTTMDRPIENGKFIDNSNQIRFGGYGIDEIDLMVYLDDPRIFAVRRFREGPIYYEWPDMETMLITETDRMLRLYNKKSNVDPLHPLPAPWM